MRRLVCPRRSNPPLERGEGRRAATSDWLYWLPAMARARAASHGGRGAKNDISHHWLFALEVASGLEGSDHGWCAASRLPPPERRGVHVAGGAMHQPVL